MRRNSKINPLSNSLGRLDKDAAWGIALVLPYVIVFIFIVVYPIIYGLVLGSNLSSYIKLFQDPIYLKSARNTLCFFL